MPRPSLGKATPDGESKRIPIKVPAELKRRLLAVLRPGEDMSKFGRAVIEREVEHREKQRP